jgi:hypothetical protein
MDELQSVSNNNVSLSREALLKENRRFKCYIILILHKMAQLKNYVVAINVNGFMSKREGKVVSEMYQNDPSRSFLYGLHTPIVFLVYNVSSKEEALRKQMLFELTKIQEYIATEPETVDNDEAASRLANDPYDEIFSHLSALATLYRLSFEFISNAQFMDIRRAIGPVIGGMSEIIRERGAENWESYVVSYVQNNFEEILQLALKFERYGFHAQGTNYLTIKEFPTYIPPSVPGFVMLASIDNDAIIAEGTNLRDQILTTGANLQHLVAQLSRENARQSEEIAQLRAYIADQAAVEPEARKRRY